MQNQPDKFPRVLIELPAINGESFYISPQDNAGLLRKSRIKTRLPRPAKSAKEAAKRLPDDLR